MRVKECFCGSVSSSAGAGPPDLKSHQQLSSAEEQVDLTPRWKFSMRRSLASVCGDDERC